MRFEELIDLYTNNIAKVTQKTMGFYELFSNLVDGHNPFEGIDTSTTRFYDQFKKDKDYTKARFKDAFDRGNFKKIEDFIDNKPESDLVNLDEALRSKVKYYRYGDNDTDCELSVGAGFARLFKQFVKQRSESKEDPGISQLFPYDSTNGYRLVLKTLANLGNFDYYNLIVLKPGTDISSGILKLSRLNSPRCSLCEPRMNLDDDEDWMNNLMRLIAPIVFIETDIMDLNMRKNPCPPSNSFAYIGYGTGEVNQVNYEDVEFKFEILGKFKADDFYANKDHFGVRIIEEESFYYGCYDNDGYAVPDPYEINPKYVEVDELKMDPIALPMWTIKTVNIRDALTISKLPAECV